MEQRIFVHSDKVQQARIGIFEIPTVINVFPNEHRLGGSMGAQVDMLLSSMHANFSFVLSDASTQLGHDDGNGTYDGGLGLLQRDLIDIAFLSYGMPVGSDIIDYSAVTNSIRGGLYSFPKAITKDCKVATTAYHVYSPSTWSSIFGLIALFSVVLRFSVKWTKRPTNGYWILTSIGSFLNQANIQNVVGTFRWLVVACLISASFFLETFEQAINMDLVAKDYSNFINNLNDLLALNYIPSYYKDDAFTNVFAKSRIKKYQCLWNKEKMLYELDPNVLPESAPQRHVFVGNEYMGLALARVYCKRDPKVTQWIAPEYFADIPSAYYLRKNLPAEVISFYTKSPVVYGMIEYGLLDGFWIQGSIRGTTTIGASDSCSTSKMDDIFPESEHKGLSMNALFEVFLLCLILEAVSVSFLLLTIAERNLTH